MRLSFWTACSSSLVVVGAALVILLITDTLLRGQLGHAASVRLEQQLDKEISLLKARLAGIGDDMASIAKGPILHSWLEASPGDPEGVALRQQVEAHFAAVVATHETYFQLRFLDTAGHERVRVDRRDHGVEITPQDALQDKSGRGYTSSILALEADEIYISPLNLNREHGVIERPIRPTLRLAEPVFDGRGERLGAVLVNLDAETLLPSREPGDTRFVMLDDQGVFLRHPDRSREFGPDLGNDVPLTAAQGEALAMLRERDGGTATLPEGLVGGEGELLAFQKVAYNPADPTARWSMVLVQPQALALASIDALRNKHVVVVLGVAMLACAVGWLLAYRVTKPLGHLTRVARRISAGDLEAEIELRGDGEIAELGTAFKLMTTRLRRMIEDERRVNETLARTNGELQRSNHDLANFTHVASHDLRTPLRALRTLPEWIRDDLEGIEVPDEVDRHLQAMQTHGERMENVISGLLVYSNTGRAESRPMPFDPQEVAEEVLARVALPDGFDIDVTCDPEPISAVLPEFEMILRNLVLNAVQHHDRDHGTIRIGGAASDQSFVLDVSDDGPGIPPEYHERVLLPFHTLKRRDEGGGTGLGLALINKIVQRSGGRLEIRSEAGSRGTAIRVTLPLAPAQRPEDAGHPGTTQEVQAA